MLCSLWDFRNCMHTSMHTILFPSPSLSFFSLEWLLGFRWATLFTCPSLSTFSMVWLLDFSWKIILFLRPSSPSFSLEWLLGFHEAILFTCLFVKGLTELIDWWRYLQPSLKNSLLSLKTNVLWPTNKPAQIPFWLNILANSKVTRALFKQRIYYSLLLWFFYGKRSCCYLLALLLTLKYN